MTFFWRAEVWSSEHSDQWVGAIRLKSCVKVDYTVTEYFRCTVGTCQCCTASPKFFSIFINDLIDYVIQIVGGVTL